MHQLIEQMSICLPCIRNKVNNSSNVTVEFSNSNIFEYKKCQVNDYDHNGNTQLHYARTYQYMNQLLNNKEINVNKQNIFGNTPLHVCTSPELAVMLLASGADPDIPNKNNQTPVHTAQNDVLREILKQFSNKI
jgi:ankyrin repeat protein